MRLFKRAFTRSSAEAFLCRREAGESALNNFTTSSSSGGGGGGSSSSSSFIGIPSGKIYRAERTGPKKPYTLKS